MINFVSVSGRPIIFGQSVSPAPGKSSIESGNPKIKPVKCITVFNRNQNQLNTRNASDQNLLSKSHLHDYLSSVLNPPIHTLDDEPFVPLD